MLETLLAAIGNTSNTVANTITNTITTNTTGMHSGSLNIIQAIALILIALGGIFLLLRVSRYLIRILIGLVINSILGFVALLLLNYIFNMGIPLTSVGVIISTALFGLPAVGTMVILKLLGASLAGLSLIPAA